MNTFSNYKKFENIGIQNVYSNFTKYISPGETEFSVENPNNVRDGIERVFSFGHLELVPEYVGEAAEMEDMDDKEKNKNEIEYDIRINAKFKEEFNEPADETRKMSFKFSKGSYAISDIINILNSEFDRNKPPGMKACPGFFDWTHPDFEPYRKDGEKFRTYIATHAPAYYDDNEAFEVATHKGYLPKSVTTGPYNDWKLPTDSSVQEDAIIRLVLWPQYTMSFSNAQILFAMGFGEDVYGTRGKNNQFHITNEDNLDAKIYKTDKPISNNVTLLTDCTVTLSMSTRSNPITTTFLSSALKERKISKFVEELSAQLEVDSLDTYLYAMRVEINAQGHVEFTIPSNNAVEFGLELPHRLAKLLNFPPGVEVTSKNAVSTAPVEDKALVNAAMGLAHANVLVLDTGPLTVTLKDCPSLTTRGRTDQLMAFLRANNSVSSMIREIQPKAAFPSQHRTLTFKIDRNSDRSQIMGLSWPVGCFVHGIFVGTPI